MQNETIFMASLFSYYQFRGDLYFLARFLSINRKQKKTFYLIFKFKTETVKKTKGYFLCFILFVKKKNKRFQVIKTKKHFLLIWLNQKFLLTTMANRTGVRQVFVLVSGVWMDQLLRNITHSHMILKSQTSWLMSCWNLKKQVLHFLEMKIHRFFKFVNATVCFIS